jgi:hypothetical protein
LWGALCFLYDTSPGLLYNYNNTHKKTTRTRYPPTVINAAPSAARILFYLTQRCKTGKAETWLACDTVTL